MIIIRCKECNTEFKTNQSYLNRGQGLFCSRSCSSKYNNKNKPSKLVEVKCSRCNKKIFRKPYIIKKFKNFYCSVQCKIEMECKSEWNCINCNMLLDHKKKQKTYCSSKCASEHQYKNYIKRWLSDEVNGGNENLSEYIRRYLFEISKNKCQKCGWGEINPKSNKIPLTVNHKNGNPTDHKPENLELICPNCHSLTPHYGGLNLGNGRRKRAEKLREWKKNLGV